MPKSKYIVNQSIVRKHRSFFVGLFVLVPIILIPSLIGFTLYRVINTELIDGWCHLYAVYENTSGLTNGNPVTISGVTIGHVKEMKLEREKRILVHFKVRKRYTSLIRKDTKALLKQKNAFVGDWLIELTGGSDKSTIVATGDTLVSELPVGVERTISQVMNTVEMVQNILQEIIDGKGTVGKLIKEDSLAVSALKMEKDFSHLALELERSVKKIDTLVLSLTDATRSSTTVIDTMQQLISNLNVSVSSTMGDINNVVKNLDTASRGVAPVLEKVHDDLGEAERMMQSLQQGWLFKKIAKTPSDPLLDKAP